MNIHVDAPALGWRGDWHDYLPLARAETRKFLKKQERGKFKYRDLLSSATVALGEAAKKFDPTRNNGFAAYALPRIHGALNDHVRDDHKVVADREMHEADYLATVAELDDCLPMARASRPRPCDIACDNPLAEDRRQRHGVTVCPPPRRIRRRVRDPFTGKWHELPSRIATSLGYKVGRRGKVGFAPKRSSYNDGLVETPGGWKRAKIDNEHDAGGYDAKVMASIRAESARGFVNSAGLRAEDKEEQDAIDYEIKHGVAQEIEEPPRVVSPVGLIGVPSPTSDLPISCGCTMPIGHFSRYGGEGSIRKPAAGNGPETRARKGGLMTILPDRPRKSLERSVFEMVCELYYEGPDNGRQRIDRQELRRTYEEAVAPRCGRKEIEYLYARIYEPAVAAAWPPPKDQQRRPMGDLALDARLLFGRGPSWHNVPWRFEDISWGPPDWPRNWGDNWLKAHFDRWEWERIGCYRRLMLRPE